MFSSENMLLMESREYALYLIRVCLIFQNESFPDIYDVHRWDTKARNLSLNYNDCVEISSSNVLNCTQWLTGNEYSINLLTALQSLCTTIKPSPNEYPYWLILPILLLIFIIICIIRKTLPPCKKEQTENQAN